MATRLPDRPISDFFAAEKPVVSVEFFPPKNEDGALQILRTANALQRSFNPDFVSITYGAGGTTRERTFKYAKFLREEYGWQVMPHLTCVGSSKDELRELIQQIHDGGYRNIMTLRGDPPKGETEFKPHPEGLGYANDLVTFIHENFPNEFCLGVGGYPEKHPEAATLDEDLANLKKKVDAGAAFVTTQMFFDNASYFEFADKCEAAGIEAPIIPGLLPVLSLEQIRKFCNFCGAVLPRALEERLDAAGGDKAQEAEVGVQWCYEQARELLDRGAPGFHLYILNRSDSALKIMERLKADHDALAAAH